MKRIALALVAVAALSLVAGLGESATESPPGDPGGLALSSRPADQAATLARDRSLGRPRGFLAACWDCGVVYMEVA